MKKTTLICGAALLVLTLVTSTAQASKRTELVSFAKTSARATCKLAHPTVTCDSSSVSIISSSDKHVIYTIDFVGRWLRSRHRLTMAYSVGGSGAYIVPKVIADTALTPAFMLIRMIKNWLVKIFRRKGEQSLANKIIAAANGFQMYALYINYSWANLAKTAYQNAP